MDQSEGQDDGGVASSSTQDDIDEGLPVCFIACYTIFVA